MFLAFANVFVYTYVELFWFIINVPRPVASKPSRRPHTKPPVSGNVTNKPQPPSIPVVDKSPPLFALIIGINEYQEVASLRGAVPDADAVQLYLEKDLGVSRSHIRNLRDKAATRTAIITELQGLATDNRIERGNPILIYFAGHGAETKTPSGWEAGAPKIQMLVPHDFRSKSNDKRVHGIPDRTIGALLDRLAKAKGDNITVILDCCHSGSGTRIGSFDKGRLARMVTAPNGLPEDLDAEIWRGTGSERASKIPAGFVHTALRSHVLLAACGMMELAQEYNGRGAFTKELIETLISVGADKITYSNILQRMHPLPAQNPQCEGVNQNRLFFDAQTPSAGRVLYSIHVEGREYVMDAGAAHGITDGATFDVYASREALSTATPLTTLVVRETSAFTSKMDPLPNAAQFSLSDPAFAIQTKAGDEEDLRLHVAMDDKLISVFEALAQEMQRKGSDRRRILLVERNKADMDIAIEDGSVVFNILNSLVTQFGLLQLPFRVPAGVDSVYPVIRAMAHYDWHLRRRNKKPTVVNNVSLHDKIHIEFKKLIQLEDELDEDYKHVLRTEGGNLNVDGVVELSIDDDREDMYGIKIINDSGLKLYAYLFFFDNSDLSIASYYEPPTAGQFKADPPLLPKESITIGYGAGGAAPLTYFLRKGQDVDVGFLKLFITTEHIDMSNIPQPSPFDDRRAGKPAQPKTIAAWDTKLVTLVQRRATAADHRRSEIATGTFNTSDVRLWNQPRAETFQVINFSKPYAAPPAVFLGLNFLDIDRNGGIRIKAHTRDLQQTSFSLHVDSWANTTLYAGGVSWLGLPADSPGLQHGQFSTQDDHPWNRPQMSTSRRITFARPFSAPPTVVVFLAQLDMASGRNWRVRANASNVDTVGFTIHIDTWADSILYSATAVWIAYPTGAEGISSGIANTMDVRRWDRPRLRNRKTVGFQNAGFKEKPSVFMALNSLDIDCQANLRLKVFADHVTEDALTWHIDSWADTVLYSAGISYICVPSI